MGLLNREMIHSDAGIRAFERMFWVFLFFIDFRIGFGNVHFDILPDIIGWILMATALGWILELHSDIKDIRTLTYGLIFLSIFDIVEIRMPMRKVGLWTALSFILGIITLLLCIMVIWRLCDVIIDMSESVGNDLIKQRADFRRKLYVVSGIAIFAGGLICMVLPPFIIPTVIAGLVLFIVAICLMMGLMKATANMCRQTSGE